MAAGVLTALIVWRTPPEIPMTRHIAVTWFGIMWGLCLIPSLASEILRARLRLYPRRCERTQIMTIIDLQVFDIRFPTSRSNAGTDAMHTDPDYSAAYVILRTDGHLEGHGLAFTIGRGNDLCAAAIAAFGPTSSG